MPSILQYDRQKAVEYAHRWAFERNPRFGDFAGIGGNCTNFVSQCLYAGVGVMNYTPTFGWYYNSMNDRAPAWTGVKYLYNFLTGNKGVGPWATEIDSTRILPGDIIQLANYLEQYHHTMIVVAVNGYKPEDILVAANSYDSDNRKLSTYDYKQIRYLHIEGVRSI